MENHQMELGSLIHPLAHISITLPQNENFHFSQDEFQLAHQLISDASEGRVTNFDRSVNCLKYYRIYLSTSFKCLRILIHLTLIVLIFFDAANLDANSKTAKITVSIESICLYFYIIQIFIVYKFSTSSIFVRDKKHFISALCIVISLIDIILFMCQVYKIRISPALRVFIYINSSEQSQIRRHLRTLVLTIKDILVILPFLLTFYFMMVSFIYRYFEINSYDSIYFYNGAPYMQSFLEIVWSTLVFITSANSPDIMLPAFSKTSAMGIFFLLFYTIFFFLLIFIYGLIMGHFRNHAKEEIKRVIIGKLSLVYDSFILLSETKDLIVEGHVIKKDVITKENWDKLMKYFPKYKNCQKASDVLFNILSGSNKPYIMKREFMVVADLFSMPITIVTDSLHFFERHLWFFFSNKLADFIEGRIFRILVAFIIIINSVCITFTNEHYVEFFFSCLFLIEIFLRIYTKGFATFFSGIWNIFDFFLISLAVIFWFVENIKFDVYTITFTLLVLRNLRLLKLLRGISAYHQLLGILGMLFPTMISLLMIVFSFTVVYVCIGILSYHGLFFPNYAQSDYMINSTTCNNTALSDIDFGRSHYCILSFNTFISGFILLCSISIGNNWHALSEGYERASGQVILSRIYFSIFKVVITYLLLLIVAFVLDIFLLAYKKKVSLKIEDSVNLKLMDMNILFMSYKDIRDSRKIKDENDSILNNTKLKPFFRISLEEKNQIWIRINIKGARTVEYVSQAMFQTEIESELKVNPKYKHFFESD